MTADAKTSARHTLAVDEAYAAMLEHIDATLANRPCAPYVFGSLPAPARSYPRKPVWGQSQPDTETEYFRFVEPGMSITGQVEYLGDTSLTMFTAPGKRACVAATSKGLQDALQTADVRPTQWVSIKRVPFAGKRYVFEITHPPAPDWAVATP